VTRPRWERLALFESSDLVVRFYTSRHGHKPSAAKAQLIATTLTQGREFFASAAGAADLVRPLLLYYGVMSLARGLILFQDRDKSRLDLSPKHGLTAKQWGLHPTASMLPNLPLVVEAGTFSEMCAATRNVEQSIVWYDYQGRGRQVMQTGAALITPGTAITLREVLGRLVDLYDLYLDTFAEHPASYRAEVVCHDINNQLETAVIQSPKHRVDVATVRAAFAVDPDLTMEESDHHFLVGQRDNIGWNVMHKSHSEMMEHLPRHRRDTEERGFIVAPLPGDIVLSSLSLYYLAAYAMGMLVRYHPGLWQGLTGKGQGDAILPILKATMRLVEEQVPALVLDQVK
jgi:hypothetical protein